MDDICRATGRQYMPAQYMLGPDQADWMEELEDVSETDKGRDDLLGVRLCGLFEFRVGSCCQYLVVFCVVKGKPVCKAQHKDWASSCQ